MDAKVTRSQESLILYILVLFFPLLGLAICLSRRKMKYAKHFFVIFCGFLGLIHIFHPQGTVLGEGVDGGRYALELIYMHNNIDSLEQFLGSLYNESELDIYQPILTYIVSRFTDNPHWLFFCFALVFGYFYSRNIWYLFDKLPDKFPKILWILIVYYILICPIWNINGVRMWTALHIFVYGAMPYIVNNRKDKLFWCFLSIFVHFSFFMPLTILLLYAIFDVKRNIKLVFAFYILSLFINTINLEVFRNVLESIPFLESKKSYISDSSIERMGEIVYSWHVVLANEISYWVIQLFIFISYYISRKVNVKELTYLLSFSLLIYGFSNIMALLPSGGRFLVLSKMFMLPVIILLLSKLLEVKKGYNGILYLSIPLIFSVIFQMRVGLDYYSIMLLIGNYFTAPFIISDVPLINYIK